MWFILPSTGFSRFASPWGATTASAAQPARSAIAVASTPFANCLSRPAVPSAP